MSSVDTQAFVALVVSILASVSSLLLILRKVYTIFYTVEKVTNPAIAAALPTPESLTSTSTTSGSPQAAASPSVTAHSDAVEPTAQSSH